MLNVRCVPAGALPYENIDNLTVMLAKLFQQSPYLPFLPKINPNDNILNRTIQNLPAIITKNNKFILDMDRNEDALNQLNNDYNNISEETLEKYNFESAFLKKYLSIIKKFKSEYAYINLLGGYSLAQFLMSNSKLLELDDVKFRKYIIQAISVKALWIINKIKSVSPDTTPIIIFEEPYIKNFGDLKKEYNYINEGFIIAMLSKITEKIKESGALVMFRCLDKFNFSIPANSGYNIIAFNAYENTDNLSIFSEDIKKYIRNGGMLNWCIAKSTTDENAKDLNISKLDKILKTNFEKMINAKIPIKFIYNSALISIINDLDSLSIMMAEKMLMLINQLGKNIKNI